MPRRHFFGRSATGIGIAALSSLLAGDLIAEEVNGVYMRSSSRRTA
jgi:hypothetical protein